MNKPPLMKSGRNMIAIALSALLPLTIAQAEEETMYPRSGEQFQHQGASGAEGPLRSDSDIDATTPTYSGEDRRQFQSETPGAEGPVRSDVESTMEQERMRSQTDPYDSHMRGAEGPARSELQTQGYTGERLDAQAFPPCAPNEKSAPNAYYGEDSAISSPQGRATLFGQGRWC